MAAIVILLPVAVLVMWPVMLWPGGSPKTWR